MWLRLSAVACGVVGALLSVAGPSAAATAVPASTSCVPPPIAHRGDSHLAPENTRPAFRTALRAGVRMLEMDVRFTSSGTPVVIHDATVDRTTNGSGPVAAMSLTKLRTLDAGSWFSRKFVRTRIPTLYEVLKDGVPYGASYLVELKVRPTPHQLAQVLDRVDRLGLRSNVVITSMNPLAVDDVRVAAPGLRTAVVDEPSYREPSSVLRYGTEYLVAHRGVTTESSLAWRESGIAVYSWTVDSKAGWLRMANEKVAGIITNRPTRYLAWARTVCAAAAAPVTTPAPAVP